MNADQILDLLLQETDEEEEKGTLEMLAKRRLVTAVLQLALAQDDANGKHTDHSHLSFPTHWGEPPQRQTRDLRELPGGYGKGSGTLATWIAEKLSEDASTRTSVAEQTDTATDRQVADPPEAGKRDGFGWAVSELGPLADVDSAADAGMFLCILSRAVGCVVSVSS